ncbi:MAG: hypothetical protein JST68_06300 [Bacteroidetes bacterium]|nr:hypothetical protein [Bacteroidota bacterium]
MHILLFVGYGLLCIYGILKMPFIRKSGIKPAVLIFLFTLHVATGIAHNWIAWRFYPEHGDIWEFYRLSFLFRTRLTSQFSLFLSDNSTLGYITHNGIIGINMILNIFSFDNLNINTLLFSFFVFLGNIALFKFLRRRFPTAPLVAFIVFLLPSTLFWTSCIHREGMLYMLLGFLLLAFDRWLTSGHRKPLYLSIFYILLITYFRFYVVLSLLPALFIWTVAKKRIPIQRILPFAGIALLALALTPFIFPALTSRIALAITAHQLDFAQLEGNSRLSLPLMDGTWGSIFRVLPAACVNGLFQPLPGTGGKTLYWAFALELMGIWILFFVALTRLKTNPFTLFCLIFALSGMIIIGAMVPFAGAIVRYRSIFLPFLLAPPLYALHSTRIFRPINTLLSRCILPKSGDTPFSY